MISSLQADVRPTEVVLLYSRTHVQWACVACRGLVLPFRESVIKRNSGCNNSPERGIGFQPHLNVCMHPGRA